MPPPAHVGLLPLCNRQPASPWAAASSSFRDHRMLTSLLILAIKALHYSVGPTLCGAVPLALISQCFLSCRDHASPLPCRRPCVTATELVAAGAAAAAAADYSGPQAHNSNAAPLPAAKHVRSGRRAFLLLLLLLLLRLLLLRLLLWLLLWLLLRLLLLGCWVLAMALLHQGMQHLRRERTGAGGEHVMECQAGEQGTTAQAPLRLLPCIAKCSCAGPPPPRPSLDPACKQPTPSNPAPWPGPTCRMCARFASRWGCRAEVSLSTPVFGL
mgnify:CR=1 FL=1